MRAFTLAIAATIALSLSAQAQSIYPEKPVRIIVDSAPGSATDVSVRLMAERLSAIWRQQAIVDNRPGGGGAIAARTGQTATPDGYTLLRWRGFDVHRTQGRAWRGAEST